MGWTRHVMSLRCKSVFRFLVGVVSSRTLFHVIHLSITVERSKKVDGLLEVGGCLRCM